MRGKIKKANKGITMIALVVTIIIMLILIAVTIALNFDLVSISKETKFKTELAAIKEKFELYKASIIDLETYDIDTLNWDGINNPTNTAKVNDSGEEDSIAQILGDISYLDNKLIIKNGELYLKGVTEVESNFGNNLGVATENSILIPEPEVIEEPFSLALTTGTIEAGNITLTVEDENVVTINGNSGSNAYAIKLTNGLGYCVKKNQTATFNTWVNGIETIIEQGKNITQEVEKISGNVTGTQLNLATRSKDLNTSFLCKLQDSNYISNFNVNLNLGFVYLYIAENVNCENLKLRINISENNNIYNNSNNIPITQTNMMYKTLKIKVNPDNSIVLNGNVDEYKNVFIKISNGIKCTDVYDESWLDVEIPIAQADKMVRFSVTESGQYNNANQINCIYKYSDNTNAFKCELHNSINSSDNITLLNNVPVVYLFFNAKASFDNYVIKPIIEIIE